MDTGTTIRRLEPEQFATMLDWAATEGWNPGLQDAIAFRAADPDGFLGLFVDGELTVTVSMVRYDASFAFGGCYICRPDRRGEGLGLELAQSAMDLGQGIATIGLDGVLEQEPNYERLGFGTDHHSIRYEADLAFDDPGDARLRTLSVPDLDELVRFERVAQVFPTGRRAFLRAWLTTPGQVAVALGPDRVVA